MSHESTGTMIVDEIDRLSVVYDKAKEYILKITSSIEQQVDIWQYRRQIILDQLIQTKSSSSYDFLLPKTQRINELTLEAVQALCRVDLLIEQILRIDPKSQIIPTRPLDTNISSSRIRLPTPSVVKQQQQQQQQPIPNGKPLGQETLPIPVLRSQQQTPSGRLSTLTIQERPGFKPVIQPPSSNISENTSRPTPIQSQNDFYPATDRLHFNRSMVPSYGTRTPQSEHMASPVPVSTASQMISSYKPRQQPQSKEKIKLQRIPPGTIWKQARIDIIDSLSGFYVENLSPNVHDKFVQMQDDLHDHYNNLEKSNQLMPLENVAIGDFGVAKYSEDNRWYRARLIMCEGRDQIKIVFIDFGNIEVKSMADFFSIHKSFTDLPAQAIACSLSHAFPRTQNENDSIWPEETIQMFKEEVINKLVEVHFAHHEEGTESWPLHFVSLTVNNQSVTSLLSLQQRIEPRPNRFIATQLAPSLSQQEYILFNVPISEDDF